ncbi:MAG: formimidoylglutamate deiminase [Robiginitomaculum sp.]|nr:MAG: formimidoylglutamate deiminase [Robiginitomaculum sp.]
MTGIPATSSLFGAQVLLADGWAKNVRISWDKAGLVYKIEPEATLGRNETRAEILIPGMANLHCHSFQRAMAAMAEFCHSQTDSFWSWRDLMYRFVAHLTPQDVGGIAAFVYMQMLQNGFTSIGEFHYLHHQRDGTPYDDPAEMANQVIVGAKTAGIELTLLPVFYAHSNFGDIAPIPSQKRFVHDVEAYQNLIEHLRQNNPGLTVGIAPHSMRAANPAQILDLLTANPNGPVHIHVAEQLVEVEACQNHLGARPVQYLLEHLEIDARWCLVHATHMDASEINGLATSGAVAGLCPITEANLGDGIFEGPQYLQASGRYGIGSDSCVRIDLCEELRLLEYSQRLRDQARVRMAPVGQHVGASMYRQAASGGAQALGQTLGQSPDGQPVGTIAPGNPASFVELDSQHPDLHSRKADAILDGWIFSAGRQAISNVWVKGSQVITNKKHVNIIELTMNYNSILMQLLTRMDQ